MSGYLSNTYFSLLPVDVCSHIFELARKEDECINRLKNNIELSRAIIRRYNCIIRSELSDIWGHYAYRMYCIEQHEEFPQDKMVYDVHLSYQTKKYLKKRRPIKNDYWQRIGRERHTIEKYSKTLNEYVSDKGQLEYECECGFMVAKSMEESHINTVYHESCNIIMLEENRKKYFSGQLGRYDRKKDELKILDKILFM